MLDKINPYLPVVNTVLLVYAVYMIFSCKSKMGA